MRYHRIQAIRERERDNETTHVGNTAHTHALTFI